MKPLMNSDLHFINRLRQQAQNLKQTTALRHQVNVGYGKILAGKTAEELDKTTHYWPAILAYKTKLPSLRTICHVGQSLTLRHYKFVAITVPIYATNTAQQAEFILNHADVRILFVGDKEQYDSALEIAENCPQLQKIVVMKDQILSKSKNSPAIGRIYWVGQATISSNTRTAIKRQKSSDLFITMRTSGTTGEPKGVMLDYANLAHQLATHDQGYVDTRKTYHSPSYLLAIFLNGLGSRIFCIVVQYSVISKTPTSARGVGSSTTNSNVCGAAFLRKKFTPPY